MMAYSKLNHQPHHYHFVSSSQGRSAAVCLQPVLVLALTFKLIHVHLFYAVHSSIQLSSSCPTYIPLPPPFPRPPSFYVIFMTALSFLVLLIYFSCLVLIFLVISLFTLICSTFCLSEEFALFCCIPTFPWPHFLYRFYQSV